MSRVADMLSGLVAVLGCSMISKQLHCKSKNLVPGWRQLGVSTSCIEVDLVK